ncbi:hypothetical protein SISNIDRAFT_489364 [Sistotremastrum niveocremeum HHB9708]|uniref:Uncharacterized protein n=2 Tax=Sistotremastraceae TaxID=3402574 RepID=A0A164Q7R1_9AGAM|nr:hypothetical protein SISNIDRAFT_489364 [Sistotremastrum niveocremeum HHB9708]KZT36247.1 hypothetical protein SISSUDRAFT_1063828 [Sistotremastrum suecicum HHB10207 ss-3]
MSLGEADAKFPGQQIQAEGPAPTRENPGGVFPKSSPERAPKESIPGTGSGNNPVSLFSNPYQFDDKLANVEAALGQLIDAIQGEESSAGGTSREESYVVKFRRWQDEILSLRRGKPVDEGEAARDVPEQEGGLFTD